MQTISVYLIFAAVVLRAAVVVSAEPEFLIVIALLVIYGLLLSGKSWLLHYRSFRYPPSSKSLLAYLFLQSILVIGALIMSSYEDFLAMLFVPLSLDAVSFFGRRAGFLSIAIFSLAMISTLLFSDVGPLFGLVMGVLYSGFCFLVGGYAYQVQKARTAHDQNEHMFSELQAAHRQLQGYADQVASLAVENERNRLARDLHDSVTQTVFSMNLAAQSAHLLWEREPPRAAGQLLRIQELATSALCEIQSLVSQLTPRSIVEDGLSSALRRLAAERKVQDGLQVLLDLQEEAKLPENVATNLYFIAQEALTNVSKHSGICEAMIRLHTGKDHFHLEIEDHGRGFHPKLDQHQPGHLGLSGMSERAREIGWGFSVWSRPGKGTRILVTRKSSGNWE